MMTILIIILILVLVLAIAVLVALDLRRDTWDPWGELGETHRDDRPAS